MPHGDETYMSHMAVPVGHYVPLDCDEDVHKQTEIAVKSAIEALGLNNCAVNVDLILRDNKVYVIELTGRVGANCLPELVEINFGIEYYKMIAAMAVQSVLQACVLLPVGKPYIMKLENGYLDCR